MPGVYRDGRADHNPLVGRPERDGLAQQVRVDALVNHAVVANARPRQGRHRGRLGQGRVEGAGEAGARTRLSAADRHHGAGRVGDHALGHAARRRGHSVLALRPDQMLKTLKHARLDNTHEQELRKLIAVDLLIIDDSGLDAMDAIERDNPSLKNVLPKNYARPALDKQRLGELMDLIGTLGLGDKANRSKDILGRVYEYFLSQFASAEGKKGGQFYTPPQVVDYMLDSIGIPARDEPDEARARAFLEKSVGDLSCGSGTFLVAAAARKSATRWSRRRAS